MSNMELIKELKENKYGEYEGKAYFAFYNDYISIVFDKSIDLQKVTENVKCLNRDFSKILDKLCEFSYLFCQDVQKNYPGVDYSEGLSTLKDYKEIVKYMKFTLIKVDETNSYNLSGECDWDRENGIQWIIEKDKVLYVGPWDDLDVTYDLEEYNNYITN